MLKQVIVVREDLDLPLGKLASQVAHASLEAALQAGKTRDEWRDAGAKKIVVRCGDDTTLRELKDRCVELGLPCYLVRDAGHTVVEPGTLTALGVGPGSENRVNRVTGGLEPV